MILRIIVIIVIAFIFLYGVFCYIDTIVKDQHDERMKGYACHMGLTDKEINEIQREDE